MKPAFLAPIGSHAPVIEDSEVTSKERVRPGHIVSASFRPQRSKVCVHAFQIENADRWQILSINVGIRGESSWPVLYKGGMTTPRHYVQVGQDCAVVAKYIGADVDGERFRASALGYEMLEA